MCGCTIVCLTWLIQIFCIDEKRRHGHKRRSRGDTSLKWDAGAQKHWAPPTAIPKALASEFKIFLQVQALYTTTTQGFQTTPQVYKINAKENFFSSLAKSNLDCEQIRSGLMEYLERKRGQFARLFFLSNEELIDIFGKGTDLVESMLEEGSKGFITNLFEGIDSVRFHELS